MKAVLAPSLRRAVLAVVLLGAIVPLGVVGIWLTRQLQRAGEDLLRREITAALDLAEGTIRQHWNARRGDLTLLAQNEVVVHALKAGAVPSDPRDLEFLRAVYTELAPFLDGVVYSAHNAATVWRLAPDPGMTIQVEALPAHARALDSRVGVLAVALPVMDETTGAELGEMTALVRLSSLLPALPPLIAPGAVFNLHDPRTRAPLLPAAAPSDAPGLMHLERTLSEPPLLLTVAALTSTYVVPFQRSARTGLLVLLAVALISFVLAAVFIARATQALERLAVAAGAVARGELERRVDEDRADEIGKVAQAFNQMTAQLNRMMSEASHRQALAAVGEFAAELAHEIRNPLTSIRLELQRVEERLPADGRLREPLRRALSTLDRLNRTVTGSLRLARSGRAVLEPLRLSAALEPAIEVAAPAFTARGVTIKRQNSDLDAVLIRGDADALTQLFVNILFNAAEAVEHAGQVLISLVEEANAVTVRVQDTGKGIPPDVLRQIHEESFHTTKKGGTGLGLQIARRIAAAHGGSIEFDTGAAVGTTVLVRLPKALQPAVAGS